jgi:hypothetical protein
MFIMKNADIISYFFARKEDVRELQTRLAGPPLAVSAGGGLYPAELLATAGILLSSSRPCPDLKNRSRPIASARVSNVSW